MRCYRSLEQAPKVLHQSYLGVEGLHLWADGSQSRLSLSASSLVSQNWRTRRESNAEERLADTRQGRSRAGYVRVAPQWTAKSSSPGAIRIGVLRSEASKAGMNVWTINDISRAEYLVSFEAVAWYPTIFSLRIVIPYAERTFLSPSSHIGSKAEILNIGI